MEANILKSAIRKLESGMPVKAVNLQTGVPVAILYQLKREVNFNDLGCVVCGKERYRDIYCKKHYLRYCKF